MRKGTVELENVNKTLGGDKKKMKTKNKTLASLEIAIMLCSVFFVAIPVIAADQNEGMQKVSATVVTTASEDDFILDIYGNANEDDTIDMGDVVYTKLAIFGKKPKTELCDAKYDGRINVLDVIQTKLIILGKEKELTIVDDTVTDIYPNGKPVTVKKPIKRIIGLNSNVPEALRTVKSKEKIVGITKFTAAKKEFFPEISKLPIVETKDIEQILSLNPDIVIGYGSDLTKFTIDLEDKLKGTNIILVRLDFNRPETQIEDIKKLGYIIDKKNEAEEFTDFYERYIDTVKERVDGLSEDEKPRIYLETWNPYQAYTQGTGPHKVCIMAGGINIAADLPGGYAKVDPEWVMVQNPDIIIKTVFKECYGFDDPSELKAIRDEIMNRPELANVVAVKSEKVYCTDKQATFIRHFVGVVYMAKWFHPELFADLDPKAINKEYLERFQGIPYRGIYVYPPLSS